VYRQRLSKNDGVTAAGAAFGAECFLGVWYGAAGLEERAGSCFGVHFPFRLAGLVVWSFVMPCGSCAWLFCNAHHCSLSVAVSFSFCHFFSLRRQPLVLRKAQIRRYKSQQAAFALVVPWDVLFWVGSSVVGFDF
jgi:hypothetical protein